jgi:hypothetical protein
MVCFPAIAASKLAQKFIGAKVKQRRQMSQKAAAGVGVN